MTIRIRRILADGHLIGVSLQQVLNEHPSLIHHVDKALKRFGGCDITEDKVQKMEAWLQKKLEGESGEKDAG